MMSGLTRLLGSVLLLIAPGIWAATASAPGDFNGDGYPDLAVGVPGQDVNGVADAGAIRIFYGTSTGLSLDGSDQIWHLASPGVPGDPQANDQLGSALTSGDFNRDGYADLAVGLPFKNKAAGQVLVLYGSLAGLVATGSRLWDQGVLLDDPEANDRFGAAVAAGDFDGDGFADLAIGVPGEDFPGVGSPENNPPKSNCNPCLDAGVVNLIHGGPAGLVATGNELWHQDRGVSFDGWVEPRDCVGASLAAGDFNGDGIDDLAAGAPCENTGGADVPPPNNGAVSVYYGSVSGLSIQGAQYLRQWADGVVGFPQAHDAFGYALAAGDFDGDGHTDLAAGVPGEDDGASIDAGAVAVFYGSAKGLVVNQLWNKATAGIGATATNARWGFAVAAGDFNADGLADLAVGAPSDDSGVVTDAGTVSIMYGSPTRLGAIGNQLISQTATGLKDFSERGDWFGFSLVAGDFNGDLVSDLAVGIPFEDLNGIADAGAVSVIFGAAGTGLAAPGNQLLNQDTPATAHPSTAGDHFGGRLVPILVQNPWSAEPTNAGLGAGPLSGVSTLAPTIVDLTDDGRVDWVHWGRSSTALLDRKAGVTPRISTFGALGGVSPTATTAMKATYLWRDGTPLAAISTRSGVKAFGVGGGFAFTVPADTTLKTLSVYVGATAAKGTLTATLSDASAPAFSTVIDQPSGKVNRVVTVAFKAASAAQTLTVRYVTNTAYLAGTSSWITLEAAALDVVYSAPPPNQPPGLNPVAGQTVTEGTALVVPVSASDTDGPAPLTLSQTNTLPGQPNILTDAGNGAGTLRWTPATGDAAQSPYSVTLTATDGRGAAATVQFSVTVLAAATVTGSLTGSLATAAATTNLTSEGLLDWVHWGRSATTQTDRKAGVTPRISTFSPVGGANPAGTSVVATTYSWTGGTPLASGSIKSGLWVFAVGKGYSFTVPADTTLKTLKVYVGATAAKGRLTATLSDNSAGPYTVLVDQPSGRTSRAITIPFRAGSAGRTLTVSYVVDTIYLPDFKSWVTLESAALR